MSEKNGVSTLTHPAGSEPVQLAESEDTPDPVQETGEPRRDRRTILRRWWARFLVLAMIVAAVLFGQQIIKGQDARDAAIDLGTVTLTSQSIPVESVVPGQVTAVAVVPGQHVTAGQRLGELLSTTTDSTGAIVDHRYPVTAPRDGIVVDDPVTVGSSLAPGLPFAKLYDPTAIRFEAQLTAAELAQITPGMTAELTPAGLETKVRAVVLRAVPVVTDADETTPRSSRITLLLAPADPSQVAGLLPGLRLTGTVDTRTAPKGAKESVYVG
jgi:multidrug resistance efflux pump